MIKETSHSLIGTTRVPDKYLSTADRKSAVVVNWNPVATPGETVGVVVGDTAATTVGAEVGTTVGALDTPAVGICVGAIEDASVGIAVGSKAG